ncbi:unnamed protein product [Arabis nemorensis]|uniref:Uncharacterized protein n=1 Tax=Arabis nemorensis TaxID=586526 RepID=A0A565C372_9BRAS|nr:unnamed protein product [Arabis nemorensis]
MVQNKPEWEVKVTNPTPCTFSNTKLSCTGFKSITTINSSVLSKPGGDDACLLHTGYNDRLRGGEHVAFKYVWDPRYDFKIASTEIACS